MIIFNASETGIDTVKDFAEEDVIKLVGYGAEFEDLNIKTFFRTSVLEIDGDTIAIIRGSDARNLEEEDFLFIG